jgi:hypothetical protein
LSCIACVNFAGCGKEGGNFTKENASQACGRLISAYDRSDIVAGSCKPTLEKMTGAFVKERVLDIGDGHKQYYTP